MSFYGDILEDAEKAYGDFDDDEPFKLPDVKLMSLKFKSDNKAGVKLAQGHDMTVKGDGFAHKHKSELEVKSGEHKVKFAVTSKDFCGEYNYAPEALNKDGLEGGLELKYKQTPGSGYEAKIEGKAGGYELGPIKGFSELQVDLESGSRSYTCSQAFGLNDLSFGGKLVAGNDFKIGTSHVLAKYSMGDQYAFLRGLVSEKFVGLGYGFKLSDTDSGVVELQAKQGSKEGMFGTPLYLRWGSNHKINGSQSLALMAQADNKSLMLTQKVGIPIDKNLKATISHQCSSLDFFLNPKDLKMKAGFAFEFKL